MGIPTSKLFILNSAAANKKRYFVMEMTNHGRCVKYYTDKEAVDSVRKGMYLRVLRRIVGEQHG